MFAKLAQFRELANMTDCLNANKVYAKLADLNYDGSLDCGVSERQSRIGVQDWPNLRPRNYDSGSPDSVS